MIVGVLLATLSSHTKVSWIIISCHLSCSIINFITMFSLFSCRGDIDRDRIGTSSNIIHNHFYRNLELHHCMAAYMQGNSTEHIITLQSSSSWILSKETRVNIQFFTRAYVPEKYNLFN